MNSWQGFQAGGLLPAATAPGYVLCAINHTPYSRIRREGGWVEALSVTGRCEVYSNGTLLGRKTEAASAPLRLRLPPGEGQRRLAFVFQVEAGEKVGLGGVVRVRV
jgi:beta-galactosidase